MIRYIWILILLFCVCPSSAAIDQHINATIWITTSNDVQILQLPPGAYACVAVPPYACREIDDMMFVVLDPDGLPLRSNPFTHVSYWLEDEEYAQPINSTIYNFAAISPTRAPILWIFMIVVLLLLKK